MPESTDVKMPHCWKPHAMAHLIKPTDHSVIHCLIFHLPDHIGKIFTVFSLHQLLPLIPEIQVKINKFFQRKIVNIFLPINFSISFGCSKERSHRDSSFEYPQHMFWLRNKKIQFSLCTLN